MNYSGIKVEIKSSWLNPENKETYNNWRKECYSLTKCPKIIKF